MAKKATAALAKSASPVARTSAGCRDALFDMLDGLRAGSVTPTLANATAKVIDGIVNTVQLELSVAKFVNRGHKKGPAIGSLALGG